MQKQNRMEEEKMMNGISLFGLNGSGKSTLAHALAKQTGYFEMDVEDYYFPEQRNSREWTMDNDKFIVTEHLGNIPSRMDIAFWVQTPLKERLKRIKMREEKRFGERVLPGGDMYIQQMEFRKVVENRDPKTVEESAKRLKCPIVVLDGTISVEENLERIMEHIVK